MKINIWIRKDEAISGNITKYYNVAPQNTDWINYVQVTVSQDEFAKLEDKSLNNSRKLTLPELDEISMRSEDWLVEQYNRNRDPKDFVKTREEIPYIYESPDGGKTVTRRRSGDYISNREQVSMGVSERDYSGEKGLNQLLEEVKDINGGDFLVWFYKLTKNEQTKLTTYYNNN